MTAAPNGPVPARPAMFQPELEAMPRPDLEALHGARKRVNSMAREIGAVLLA